MTDETAAKISSSTKYNSSVFIVPSENYNQNCHSQKSDNQTYEISNENECFSLPSEHNFIDSKNLSNESITASTPLQNNENYQSSMCYSEVENNNHNQTSPKTTLIKNTDLSEKDEGTSMPNSFSGDKNSDTNRLYLHAILSNAHQSLVESHDLVMEECSVRSVTSVGFLNSLTKNGVSELANVDSCTEESSLSCLCFAFQSCW